MDIPLAYIPDKAHLTNSLGALYDRSRPGSHRLRQVRRNLLQAFYVAWRLWLQPGKY